MIVKKLFYAFCIFFIISCARQKKGNVIQTENEQNEKTNLNLLVDTSFEKYIEKIIDPIKQFRLLKDIIEIDLGDYTNKYFLVILENINTAINEIYFNLYIFNFLFIFHLNSLLFNLFSIKI
jgi:hypothetical protein